jgi:predicted permease
MSIPLLAGRDFLETDQDVIILSAKAALRIWPGRDPIGRKVHRGGDRQSPALTVVGVAGDVAGTALDKAPELIGYLPYWHRPPSEITICVRTGTSLSVMAGQLRAAVWEIDRDIPLQPVRAMEDLVSASVAQRRFQTLLVSAFGALALLLACLGILGVVSYSVSRRTNEIGVRMALGARRGDVLGMVCRRGMAPVAAGLAIGLAGSLMAGRVVRGFLFEVSAVDPLTYGLVILVLGVAAMVACLAPAGRAARLDPMKALRYE